MDRESLVYKAKLAEKAERFNDMAEAIKKVLVTTAETTPDERNLFSVAYKNKLTAKRLSWRALFMVEQHEGVEHPKKLYANLQNYRKEIESEIDLLCGEVLTLINKYLLPKASTNEAKIYFLKMKGDYNRYLSEILVGEKRKITSENAAVAYKEATELAVTELAPTNPIRLGLALNFSVLFYEIFNSTEKACRLARAAFDDAVAELDTLSDETYKDATLIMQLLRDNLTLWTKENQSYLNNGPDI